jgi:hypothetical protein
MCLNCKHFDFKDQTKNSCAAYREEIPSEILDSRVDHRKPYKGDGGIQFEPLRSLSALGTASFIAFLAWV